MKRDRINRLKFLNKIKKKDLNAFLNNQASNKVIRCICNQAYDVLYTNKFKIPFKEKKKYQKYILKKFSRGNICEIANKRLPIHRRKLALLQEGGNFVDWLKRTVDKVNIFLQKAVIGDW